MSDFKGTPGPWGGKSIRWHPIHFEKSCGLVCPIQPDDETEANSRLIKAAPELLEAIIKLLPLASMYAGSQPYTNAQSAIAKAMGE